MAASEGPLLVKDRHPDHGLLDAGLLRAAGVKGAILRECPDAVIVDVTHDLEPFNLREASFVLWQAAPCFPEGTVHAAVVFPETGVGEVVAVRAGGHYLVGPDNRGPLHGRRLAGGRGGPPREGHIPPPSCKTFYGRFLVARRPAGPCRPLGPR
ncbi:MAG: hypothetical protein DRO01_00810 [Thermoproteota archaeon]|nr:MAG: hypothetical protein DRO01_00810 [Candidatus Korarchaeota archaeon]